MTTSVLRPLDPELVRRLEESVAELKGVLASDLERVLYPDVTEADLEGCPPEDRLKATIVLQAIADERKGRGFFTMTVNGVEVDVKNLKVKSVFKGGK